MSATPINNTSANVDLDVFSSAGHEYCHAGDQPDSNLQAGGVAVGGAEADHRIVTREGGADDPRGTQGPGGPGRTLA